MHIDFVCTGNICRSPMAEVIVRSKLEDAGLGDAVRVSSSGIGDWHVGHKADERARRELANHGGPEGFTVVREQIEAAADGIIHWVRDR